MNWRHDIYSLFNSCKKQTKTKRKNNKFGGLTGQLRCYVWACFLAESLLVPHILLVKVSGFSLFTTSAKLFGAAWSSGRVDVMLNDTELLDQLVSFEDMWLCRNFAVTSSRLH